MKKIIRFIKYGMAAVLIVCIVFGTGCSASFAEQAATGGIVTDTLTIKVGYWGMEEKDFIEKATYRYNELDDTLEGALETHQQAYSFFRESDDGGYKTVIDSARGFYIKDLLTYAGINQNDIEGISFYTQDQDIGYFTNFSYEELFSVKRYFFPDLSYYTKQTLDDSDNPTGECTIDPAVWDQAQEVEPMLALEDSWKDYEPGYEHTAPDYTGLSTGNRFRLLFGQTAPDESRTNQTAKYTHSLYVQLNGTPLITTDDVELENKIGSGYTTEFTMSTSDDAFNEAVKKLMEWNSSDENVLKITDVQIEEDPQYEDAVKVRITYDILSDGTASISGSFLGAKVKTKDGSTEGISMKSREDDSEKDNSDQEETDSEAKADGSNSESSDDSGEKETASGGSSQDNSGQSSSNASSSTDSGSAQSGGSQGSAGITENKTGSGQQAAVGSGSSGSKTASSSNAASSRSGNSRNADSSAKTESADSAENPDTEETGSEGPRMYELDEETASRLSQGNPEVQETDQASDPDYDTLKIKKNEDQSDSGWKLLLIFTILLAAGAGIGIVRYLRGTGRLIIRKRGKIRYV